MSEWILRSAQTKPLRKLVKGTFVLPQNDLVLYSKMTKAGPHLNLKSPNTEHSCEINFHLHISTSKLRKSRHPPGLSRQADDFGVAQHSECAHVLICGAFNISEQFVSTNNLQCSESFALVSGLANTQGER